MARITLPVESPPQVELATVSLASDDKMVILNFRGSRTFSMDSYDATVISEVKALFATLTAILEGHVVATRGLQPHAKPVVVEAESPMRGVR